MRRKKRGKTSFFKENYLASLKYLKLSKNFIYIAVLLFFIFSLIGFFIPSPNYLSNTIIEFILELIEKTQGMSASQLIWFILLNNFKSSFFGMIFGILIGIFPIMAIIANGYLLGFVASISVKEQGFFVLWKIFPHGIFELPAIFISLGLGLKLGMFIFQKDKIKSFKEFFQNSLRVFLFIVLPLLIIAAIIEGTFIFLFK